MVIGPVAYIKVTVVVSHGGQSPANKETAQSQPQPPATDTVQISSLGKALAAMQAAMQEATETHHQTLIGPGNVGPQAQHLLLKEAAADEEAKESPQSRPRKQGSSK